MRRENRMYLNRDWIFTEDFCEEMITKEIKGQQVMLPHSVKETPYNYFDAKEYQMVSGYQKTFVADESFLKKRCFLIFEGVAHEATVYVNGKELVTHSCGYTAFEVEITKELKIGEKNLITVKVDSRESLNIPPFGHVIDYMTYGGIYREVYLELREQSFLKDAFFYSEDVLKQPKLLVDYEIENETQDMEIVLSMKAVEQSQTQILLQEKVSKNNPRLLTLVPQIQLWSPENPKLYEVKLELSKAGKIIDTITNRIGFREAIFQKDGFYLNGKKYKIRGANRHQSFAYVGYAMPKSMQELDAKILKEELKLNAVRTSHYPQSQYFMDACDELGLMVFTEMPGWQHIGNDEWKNQAVKNVEEMVLQYRNHPSIILWGVRINESLDDEAFYTRTNKLAHELDPTRATSGVRYLEKSQLLEDVYAFNDFSHTGENKGAKQKQEVTSDMEKGYLVSEYNGHMYPTKVFDDEKHRVEHMLRHARVLNAISGYSDTAGSFMWCMFDYNTHKDFGSGDRICYHGILDMFRNKKQASYVYSVLQEEEMQMEVMSTMDIGEYAGGFLGDTYVLTNADSVRLYKNDLFIKEFFKEESAFENLAHGPILIDDFIGEQLVEIEKLPKATASGVKKLLLAVGKYGMTNLPLSAKLTAAKLILFHGMKFEDGVKYYNKYLGNWGAEVTKYKFEAIKDGKVVKTVYKEPVNGIQMKVDVSATTLLEENTYDVALARITFVDQNGNVLPFFQEPMKVSTEGNIELIGPDVVSAKGGMSGVYVKTTGKSGTGVLILETKQTGVKKITFQVNTK